MEDRPPFFKGKDNGQGPGFWAKTSQTRHKAGHQKPPPLPSLLLLQGLHLSSMLWFLSLFSLRRIFIFALFPMVFFLGGFFAFQRVYFIKLLGELLQMRKCYIDSKYLFFFVFSIEFIFRAQLNPLSFTYSFLFLGIIYSLRKSSPFILILGFWVWFRPLFLPLQLTLFIFFSFPLNSIITFLITLLYPFVLLNMLVPIKICSCLYDLILICNTILLDWDILVNPVYIAVLLAIILMENLRKVGVIIVGFISTALY